MHAPSDDSTVAFLDAIFTIPADARKYIPPAPRRKKTKAPAKTDDEYAYRTHRMAQVSGRSAKRKKPETDGHHTTTEEAATEKAKVKAMTVTHIALCSGPVALDVTAGFEAGAWAETSWAMFLQPERRKR
ncbi:hypothetical protein J1614_011445 [Plenodomus biglobosus]|nr:hypothetical protein J1614_011445 [Plenodomus biglobosus]